MIEESEPGKVHATFRKSDQYSRKEASAWKAGRGSSENPYRISNKSWAKYRKRSWVKEASGRKDEKERVLAAES